MVEICRIDSQNDAIFAARDTFSNALHLAAHRQGYRGPPKYFSYEGMVTL